MTDDTHYLVTGAGRSGTSMSVRFCEFGGMDCYYEPEPNGNAQNKYGNFEPSVKEFRRTPIDSSGIACLFKHPGKVIKIIPEHMIYIPGDRAYKVLLILRDPKAITASARRVWKKSLATEIYQHKEQYHCDIGEIVYKVTSLPDATLTILHYDKVIENPIDEITKLQADGWPIDPMEAAKGIDKTQRHFK